MPTEPKAFVNTDRELWRERENDFYADSIHVTESGGIGMNHGGKVIVMPICLWHKLHYDYGMLQERCAEAMEELDGLADLLADSEEIIVSETPVVQKLNEIIDSFS